MKRERTWDSQENLEEKDKDGSLILSNIKTYSRAVITKTMHWGRMHTKIKGTEQSRYRSQNCRTT